MAVKRTSFRSADFDPAEAHDQRRAPGTAFSKPCWEIDLVARDLAPPIQRREQSTAIGQHTILARPAQQMSIGVRQAHPLLVDIAFAIGHDGDPCGRCAEQFLGGIGADQPAVGFLFFDRQRAVIGRLCFLASPNLRVNEAQAGAVIGIHRQNRMQEQPDVGAVADSPEIMLAVCLRLVINLGCILNRQNVTPAHQAGGPLADGLNDFSHLHPNIIQKAPEFSLAGPVVSQLTHAQCLAFCNSIDKGGAPFSRRASPKHPSSSSAIVAFPESRR